MTLRVSAETKLANRLEARLPGPDGQLPVQILISAMNDCDITEFHFTSMNFSSVQSKEGPTDMIKISMDPHNSERPMTALE
jgi:hypothetical protein